MRRPRSLVGVALALPLLSAWFAPSAPTAAHATASADDWIRSASCAVCHPGAVKALRYSVHINLVRDAADVNHTSADGACVSCHGEQSAHARSALDPTATMVKPDPVSAAACATCHAGRNLVPAQGSHPWSPQLDRVPGGVPAPRIDSAPPQLRETVRQLEDGAAFGMDLGLMARAGYRFVNVYGSRARFDTDVNLDGGVRLTDLELDARGRPGAILDRAHLSLTDLADPFTRLRGELAKDSLGTLKARYQRDIFKYRARGDFHRVDVRAQEWGTDLEVPIGKDAALLGSFTRRLQDGFWLTNRIGNRNVNPQTTVPGVQSPRDHDLELYEFGLRTNWLGMPATLTGEYRNLRDVDSFTYAQPSAVNPAFPESEDFTSASSLRGPGARLQVADSNDTTAFSFSARVVTLDRRIRGNGITRGFDISEFDTTTTAFASGEATTWLLDATLDHELREGLHGLVDLRWRDHEEELRIDQVDVTRYPSLGNSTTTTTALDQRTAQRALEGSVGLQVEPTQGLRIAAGWGFVRERLRVPDLESGDPDFVVGDIDNDGVLVDASWQPSERWVVSGKYRDYGQNGLQLHELSDDEVRAWKAKVRYQPKRWWIEVFSEQRRRDNDVSATKLDAWTTGFTANRRLGDEGAERGDVWFTYAYTDLESRTLTNFYFDPSPTPVPTFVGFDGLTHSLSAGLGWDLAPRVRLDVSASYTDTQGTFAVQVFDWRADLSTRVCSSADLGIMVRQVDYQEDLRQSGGLDDYGSYLTFVYFRTTVGTLREK